MTREETLGIMSIMKAAYPASFRGMTQKDAAAMVNLWAELFAADDVRIVAAAVKSYIVDNTAFFPSIGQVKEKMRLLTRQHELTEGEAWALVEKATRNGFYGAEEEFSALPEAIQAVVGSANQLREWAKMDADIVHSVIMSNFQRAYRATAARREEYRRLPENVKALIGGIAERTKPKELNE